jgi:hypothetical protein
MDERLWAALEVEADPDLRDFFLERLVALAIRQGATTQPGERWVLGMALLSTFLDCVDLGLTEQAYRTIAFVRTAFAPVAVVENDGEAAV